MKDANVIGRKVAYLRNQRGWSQNDLVAELHLLGCINMTREILANIETLRSPATCKQIEFFAEVFGVPVQELFPRSRTSLERRSAWNSESSHDGDGMTLSQW